MSLDVLFVNPVNSFGIYQDLAKHYTTIEPPTWAVLLAGSCRANGYKVGILDCGAERLSDEEAVNRIILSNARLICFVIYGQNVNASTVGMSGGVRLSTKIKESGCKIPIAYIGGYVQSLPKKALEDEPSIDIVFTNEGVRALNNLLKSKLTTTYDFENIKGIGWRMYSPYDKDECQIVINPPEQIVQDLDKELPEYAWDLLPYKEKPFDLYRAPMWHAEYKEENRLPYAAIQTSLGCPFGCEFCTINMINRNDNEEIGIAGNYSKIRYWSPEFVIKEFEKLYNYGVRTIKITDELFLLNKTHYLPICKGLIEKGYGKDLRLWAYSRVDTVSNPENLKTLKEAGMKWLALGIENSNRNIRLEVSKGTFKDIDINKVVQQIHDSGIQIMANYIFGLPGETLESMKATSDLSKELCTSAANIYSAVNLPGSQLYADAIKRGIEMPKTYTEYSFHSYDLICNSTENLTAAQIIKARDEWFVDYHTYSPFLGRIKNLYGQEQVDNIKEMIKVKLRRKLLGD